MDYLEKVMAQMKENILGFSYSEDDIFRWVNQTEFDQLIELLKNYDEDRKSADDFIIDSLREAEDVVEEDALAIVWMREPDVEWLEEMWTGEKKLPPKSLYTKPDLETEKGGQLSRQIEIFTEGKFLEVVSYFEDLWGVEITTDQNRHTYDIDGEPVVIIAGEVAGDDYIYIEHVFLTELEMGEIKNHIEKLNLKVKEYSD